MAAGSTGKHQGRHRPRRPPRPGLQLNMLAQYTKDLSFENPNAPKSLGQPAQQPAINVQINVSPNQLSSTDFEIELKLEGKAEISGTVLFNFQLIYVAFFGYRIFRRSKSGRLS